MPTSSHTRIRGAASSEASAAGSTRCFSHRVPGIRKDKAMTTIDHDVDMVLRLPPVRDEFELPSIVEPAADLECPLPLHVRILDRKSTRLNSSHLVISYAVFCLKKKK